MRLEIKKIKVNGVKCLGHHDGNVRCYSELCSQQRYLLCKSHVLAPLSIITSSAAVNVYRRHLLAENGRRRLLTHHSGFMIGVTITLFKCC